MRKRRVHFDTSAHVGKISLSLDVAQASRPVENDSTCREYGLVDMVQALCLALKWCSHSLVSVVLTALCRQFSRPCVGSFHDLVSAVFTALCW